MLTIKKSLQEDHAIVALQGRIDTVTASDLEKELQETIPAASDLTLDFAEVDYISSAGLRVLLSSQKLISGKHGQMKLTHVDPMIMGIFEMTGFSDILTIE